MTRIEYITSGFLLSLILSVSACATTTPPPVETTLIDRLTPPEATGIRWGVLVTDLDGNRLVKHNAHARFSPASNTKLFTTAAAFHYLDALEHRAPALATRLDIEPGSATTLPNLVLTGYGDPGVKTGPDCAGSCFDALAAQVKAQGITEIGDLIGDASWFPAAAWPVGWSWEDLSWGYGTAVSALSVQDNIYHITLRPGAKPGEAARAEFDTAEPYYEVHNQSRTLAQDADGLGVARAQGAQQVTLGGTIAVHTPPQRLPLGVDDPAHYAAWHLRQALNRAGIAIRGTLRTRKAESPMLSNPASETCAPAAAAFTPPNSMPALAKLPPPDWQNALRIINKDSQNLYAELILRQIGKLCGAGTSADGLAEIETLLSKIGVPRTGYDFFDGSGMSVYNRVSPAVIVALLRFAADQPWSTAWRDTLPIGGVDGGLKRRFVGTPLAGKVFAKTGTLKGVNALSGYMIAASGKTLAFSIMANDRPLGLRSAIEFMDAALVDIAAAH